MTARTSLPSLPPLALLAAPLALCLGAGPAGDEPAFAPGRYTVLTKSYTEETQLEVDSFDILVDGVPMEQELPEVTVDLTRSVVFSDEYQELGEGRVNKLLRTFEELGSESTVVVDFGEVEEHTATTASRLQDATVLFEWRPEDERYEKTFEEGGGDEALLEGLAQDADLLGFLPAGPVDEGDEWEVDPAALGLVLAPGGDLWLVPDDFGDEPYVNLELPAMVAATVTHLGEAGDLSGTIGATYTGRDEVEGVSVGRIELELEVILDADLTESLKRAADAIGGDLPYTMDELQVEWSLQGSGELLWNLEAGHAYSFRWEGDVELAVALGWTQEMFEQELTLEGRYSLSGTSAMGLRVGD